MNTLTVNLWGGSGRLVEGESCMFAGKRSANLAFAAESVARVYNRTTGIEYRRGVDFEHDAGSNEIRLTSGSAIPFLDHDALYPPEGAVLYPEPGCTAIGGGTGGQLLRFDGNAFFERNQVMADYTAASLDFPVSPERWAERLPRLRARLAVGAPLKITAIGDSITDGYNASGKVGVEPYQPPYIGLFARALRNRFGSEAALVNRAVSGSGCRHAFELAEQWLGDAPDLLVIAYGMNDFSSLTAADFTAVIAKIIATMRRKNPQTEFLPVAGMSGNPEWKPTVPGRDREFAAALYELVRREDSGVALADVYGVWAELTARKGFYSLTGNGVNHPNDYGHRVYNTVLMDLFHR